MGHRAPGGRPARDAPQLVSSLAALASAPMRRLPRARRAGAHLHGAGVGLQPGRSCWNAPAPDPVPYQPRGRCRPRAGQRRGQAAVDGGFASGGPHLCIDVARGQRRTTSVARASSDRENSILWVSARGPRSLARSTSYRRHDPRVPRRRLPRRRHPIQQRRLHLNTTAAAAWTRSRSRRTRRATSSASTTPTRGAVMFASYSGGVLRARSADDIAGVCALYPSGGAVPDAGVAPDAGVTPPPTDPARVRPPARAARPQRLRLVRGPQPLHVGTSTGPSGAACGGAWRGSRRSDAAATPDAASVADAGVADLRSYAGCGTCTPVNGCGCVGATNQCVSGTQTGSLRDACASGYARFWPSVRRRPPRPGRRSSASRS